MAVVSNGLVLNIGVCVTDVDVIPSRVDDALVKIEAEVAGVETLYRLLLVNMAVVSNRLVLNSGVCVTDVDVIPSRVDDALLKMKAEVAGVETSN